MINRRKLARLSKAAAVTTLLACSNLAHGVLVNGGSFTRTTEPTGANFSLLHVGPGTSGATTHNVQDTAFSFDWNDVDSSGSLTENDTVTLSSITLDLTPSGSNSGTTLTLNGTLTVGMAYGSFPSGTYPEGEPTNLVGGSLNYSINDGANVWGNTFVFDAAQFSGTYFNGAGMSGNMLTLYLWGVGGQETCFTGSCATSDLLASRAIDLGITGSPVPVPAAVWLFGSGLIGMVGVARRRKA